MRGTAVVTGAGGFIGHHLVSYLKKRDWWVRGVDIKHPEFRASEADEFALVDLRDPAEAAEVLDGVGEVYALAADMGGMGYLTSAPASILRNNMLINANTLEAARSHGVSRYFFASSACVYPEYAQLEANVRALREDDAYPAQPQDSYGWEKLITERLCQYYAEQFEMTVRIARYHNVYGPYGTYRGGREKAPAALCRKVAECAGDTFEVWGDGQQTRSFCYIDDCLEGTYRLMRGAHSEPLNIGSAQLVTIAELAELVVRVAGKTGVVRPAYVSGPQGVRGRNSDNSRVRSILGWSPETALEQGIAETYRWIASMTRQSQPEALGS